jgi:hypothetical protein
MQSLSATLPNVESLEQNIKPIEAAKPKAGFLRPLDEMIMLAIPTIGILLTIAIQLFSKVNHATFKVDDVTTLLTTLVFMDGVHVTFTFMLIACLPELRNWSKASENKGQVFMKKDASFWKRMAIVAGGLTLVVFVLKVSPESSMIRGMATIWLFLELLGPSQHTAAQMRGISFVYNSTIRRAYTFNAEEQARAVSAEKWERYLFKLLILGDVLYWIPRIFIQDRFSIPYMGLVQYIGAISVGASAIGLLLNSFRYPKQGETDKTFFLTRVLLFPFKIINPVGGLAIRATHGTEYLLIFRRIVQSSSISDAKKKRAYWLTAGVSFFYGLIFVSIWPGTMFHLFGFNPPRNLVGIALMITFVVRFTHYYMDALVFKMSDPMTRAAMSPLLVPKNR